MYFNVNFFFFAHFYSLVEKVKMEIYFLIHYELKRQYISNKVHCVFPCYISQQSFFYSLTSSKIVFNTKEPCGVLSPS